MSNKISGAKATTADIELRRKEWQSLVELHKAYGKHKVYDPNVVSQVASPIREDICLCTLCGVPLMRWNSWWHSADDVQYKELSFAAENDADSRWSAGKLTAYVVNKVPKQYRHFLYEALLPRLTDDKTSDEERAAILSCRDKSVPSDNLRKYALETGGVFAYAFAKYMGDWADDLLTAARTCAKSTMKFLADSRIAPTDADRIAISRDNTLALEFAKTVDKGPHQVTRDGAAKHPVTALDYAIEIDKNPDTATSRGTKLKTISFRHSNGVARWIMAFKGGVQPDDKSRKAACRTIYGAFQYAESVDKCAHPVTEAVLIRSRYYGCRYMYEIACAPVKNIEISFSGGYDALRYMGVFNIKPSPMLYNYCRRNSLTYKMYEAVCSVQNKPIDRQTALKKSVLSAGYIILNDCYNDKGLMASASRNSGYNYMLDGIVRTRKSIANKLAGRQAAALASPTV